VIEFETVVTPGMEDAGLGALGEPVALYGELLTVSSGRTLGRAWSRVIVSAEVIRHGTASRVLIDSVLGAHRTVTVTSDRGFAQGAPVILLHVPYRAGALTFAPGSYRTIPDPNCPDRYAIRFLGTTFPLRLRRG
jgi:hypothetical protein